MEKKTQETQTLEIEKTHIAPLIARFGLLRNELFGLFALPAAAEGSAAAAGAWWQKLSEEQQHLYRGALAAIASPMLIADVGIIARNERLVNTHAALPSLRWNDPVYLYAGQENTARYRLEYLRQADLFTNTLLLHLQGAAPVYEMELKFTIPVRDFAVLLAAVDLRQRLRYKALLEHTAFPVAYPADAVTAAVSEGFLYPDPRWLLPFCLSALHLKADEGPDTVRQSLDRLAGTGLLRREGGNITFTEPGERFAESVAERYGCIRIETYGVDEQGNPGRQSVLLIRGEHFLWYAGLSSAKTDNIVVTTIGLDQAETLIRELFTPQGEPKAFDSSRPTAAPAVLRAPAPAAATAQPAAAGSLVCKACGNPIKPGDKFCSKCLVKVPETPVPATATPQPQTVPQPPAPAVPAAGSLVCKACGNPIRPGDKFCSKCLVKVLEVTGPAPQPASSTAPAAGSDLVCKSCGAPLRPGLKFCSNCGTKIG